MTTTQTEPAGRGRRRRPRYGRELAIILVVKTLALAAIWQLWFAPPSRPRIDAAAIAARVYSSAAAPAEDHLARP